MRASRSMGLLASALVLALHTPAFADDSGSASTKADLHFSRAVELMKADNCAEAVPEFLSSQHLEPSAATLVNLATCYARLGRSATAWKTYREASTLAATEKNDVLRERALHAMSVIGPTLTKLQIVTNSPAPLSIRVNGEELSDYDGLPIPLDPGESVIEAASPGHEPWRKSVSAGDLGATIVIAVPDLRPLPSPAAKVQAVGPQAPPPASEGGADLRLPAALVGGAGLVSIIVGTAFGLSAKSSYDDSQMYCRANACTRPGIDLRDSAYDKAAVSTVTIGLGLVAVAAGVVLWLSAPSGQRAAHQAKATASGLGIDNSGFRLQVVSER